MIHCGLFPGLKVIGNIHANVYVYTRYKTEWTVTNVDEEELDVYIVASKLFDKYTKNHPNLPLREIYSLINNNERTSAFMIHKPDFIKNFDVQYTSQTTLASHVLERYDF